jgi:hypothetical protein
MPPSVEKIEKITYTLGKNTRESVLHWTETPCAAMFAIEANYDPHNPASPWTSLGTTTRRSKLVTVPNPGAFRRLAHQHHPDRHPGDPAAMERFRAINVAYQEWQAGRAPPANPPPPDPEADARLLSQLQALIQSMPATQEKPVSRAGKILFYGVLALMLVAFLVMQYFEAMRPL